MGSALDAYNFILPTDQIAQRPLVRRDASRLMVLRRGRPGCIHRTFVDLPELLPPGAVLVFNNTQVIPARLLGEREGGFPVEALLIAEESPGRWHAMVKPARRLKAGQTLRFADGLIPARCLARTAQGHWVLEFEDPATFRQRLEKGGLTPLPPYIRRASSTMEEERQVRESYQTVYASCPGAVAAPTAGLHFTPQMLQELDRLGFERVEITLHVGPGTFAPVQVDDPAKHHMHAETFNISKEAAERLLAARDQGRPVVAVGTTAVRSLETWARQGLPSGTTGSTDLFIYPPFDFRVVDGMLTNFHLPKSTLLMLVAAFHGRERMLAAYAEAVTGGYRFFSFGDAMIILR